MALTTHLGMLSVTQHWEHSCSVDRIKGFLEIHKDNSKWGLVFFETFHDSSQCVDLLRRASRRGSTCGRIQFNKILLYTIAAMDMREMPS